MPCAPTDNGFPKKTAKGCADEGKANKEQRLLSVLLAIPRFMDNSEIKVLPVLKRKSNI